MRRLGILVTSIHDLDTVWQLVRAARGKGVKVYVHLMGEGVQAIEAPIFQPLSHAATVTICRSSAHNLGFSDAALGHLDHALTTPNHITDLVGRCDRSMIF